MTWPLAPLKKQHYRVILLDPPWRFAAGVKGRPQHYPRMRDHEIAALPIADLAHPEGAWVFVWTTGPKLSDLFTKIVPGWGRKGLRCKYSGRGLLWAKLVKSAGAHGEPLFFMRHQFHTGMGYTTRKNAEDCLLFKFGRPKRARKDVRELLISPLRENSRKPTEAHHRIEAFAEGPYCELFARASRPGWDVWGNETTKFDGGSCDASQVLHTSDRRARALADVGA